MPVTKQKFCPPDDRLTGAACRRPDVNPDWWTDVHHTRSHLKCSHALARHMCLFHCPVLAECAEDQDMWGTDWNGMVIAGQMRTVVAGKAMVAKNQPSGSVLCRICIGS